MSKDLGVKMAGTIQTHLTQMQSTSTEPEGGGRGWMVIVLIRLVGAAALNN